MTGERRARIADFVNRRGSARVNELADAFETSAVTIRNDLTQLEREGRLVRDRGGATAARRTITSLLAVEERAHLRIEEKRRIARAAAAFVDPGDTLLMDAGTTVVEMVPHLAKLEDLTVVTNALNVAIQVGAQTDAHVILLGGTYNRVSTSVLGPMAEQQLAELSVQKLFLGTQAFDIEQGLTDTTIEIAQIKRRMIQSAREVLLLTDSGKWDCIGFSKVAPLTAIQTLITDTNLPDAARSAIEELGIRTLLV
jgi:DeoR/GlpR family transcriptional regulator of sugar metabolism